MGQDRLFRAKGSETFSVNVSMSRQKLRPENNTINWAYACKIVGGSPTIIFDTAKAMRELWNGLVTLHESLPCRILGNAAYLANKDAYKASLAGHDEDAERLRALVASWKAAAKEMQKDQYAEMWRKAYVHTRDQGEALGLPVWCKWGVYEKFQTAMKAAAKGIRGWPRKQYGLENIQIPQRTDSGKGWDVSELFRRRKPFSVRPEIEQDGRYEGWEAQGWFSIKDERIPIRVIMHRPFPAGAIVKRYSLLGHYEKSSRQWSWRMLFTLEIPPVNILYPLTNRAAAIDAGWRKMKDEDRILEDRIRVAVIYDGHRAYELSVPFDLSNTRERRRSAEQSDKPRIDIRETWAIKSRRDGWLEDCKAQIRRLDVSGWPDDAIKSLTGIVKMRAGGLMRIRAILNGDGLRCEPIESWLAKDGPAWQQQRYIEQRWVATRDHLYRNFAVEIAEQIDTLIWEGDLGLKQMAEDAGKKKERRKGKKAQSGEWDERTPDERTLEASQKWRQMASLHKLRGWIREEMKERGKEIIEDETAYSSQICPKCNGKIESSPKLIVQCENGHVADQDVNAARYYWNRLDEDLRAVAGSLASVKRSQVLPGWRVLSA